MNSSNSYTGVIDKIFSSYYQKRTSFLELVYFGGPENYFPKFWWLFEHGMNITKYRKQIFLFVFEGWPWQG